jgi:pimeloyl-ACP methyl ester carboxylesterase
MSCTIVLVHGAFAASASWDRVIDPLVAEGYRVVTAANPLRGLAADAAAVSDLVRTIEGPVPRSDGTTDLYIAPDSAVSRPDATVHPILEAAALRVAV